MKPLAFNRQRMDLFKINKDACIGCYACVRVCPVKAIEVKAEENVAKILPNRCIGCGSCKNICPVDAIDYHESIIETKEILNSGGKIAAICAPSISGEFVDITDYRKFVQMIKALGFTYVCEVSIGVDLVAQKYQELFENFNGKYYLSTCCPVVVQLVEKFHPDLVSNLAPIISPMVATAKIVRNTYGSDVKVVYIGPCIANKNEALKYSDDGKIDSVLTFVELRQLFKEQNINEGMLEYSEFDKPIGYKGSLFPISNGLLQAVDISEDLLTGEVITAEGRNSVLESVREFELSIETIKRHFNLFYCDGCIMGPGTSRGGRPYIRRSITIDYVKKRLKTFDKSEWDKAVMKHSTLNFATTFTPNDQRLQEPSGEKVKEILKVIGKEFIKSESGCGACGYDSCNDFAVAVSKGLAHTDMCLNFTLKNRQEYIKNLKGTNEKLAKTQEALRDSEKIAKVEQLAAKDAMETVDAMLQKLPSAVVIADKKLKIVHSNQSFIDLLGDDALEISDIIPGLIGADLKTLLPYNIYNQFSYALQNGEDVMNRDLSYKEGLLNVSVFTIKRGNVVGAILRDMYAPEVRKEEVIKRVTEVIDKNLAMVQEIGFLLGEGASETEQMLNSILKTYKDGPRR